MRDFDLLYWYHGGIVLIAGLRMLISKHTLRVCMPMKIAGAEMQGCTAIETINGHIMGETSG